MAPGSGVDGVVADEQTPGHRKPGVAHDVGIAEEAGEAVPVREFELAFRAVDYGLAESYGEADGGAENLVVVGVVVDVTAEIVGVEAELIEQAFAGADFEIVAVRRDSTRLRWANWPEEYFRTTGSGTPDHTRREQSGWPRRNSEPGKSAG
jgi:hypothetical protein